MADLPYRMWPTCVRRVSVADNSGFPSAPSPLLAAAVALSVALAPLAAPGAALAVDSSEQRAERLAEQKEVLAAEAAKAKFSLGRASLVEAAKRQAEVQSIERQVRRLYARLH